MICNKLTVWVLAVRGEATSAIQSPRRFDVGPKGKQTCIPLISRQRGRARTVDIRCGVRDRLCGAEDGVEGAPGVEGDPHAQGGF